MEFWFWALYIALPIVTLWLIWKWFGPPKKSRRKIKPRKRINGHIHKFKLDPYHSNEYIFWTCKRGPEICLEVRWARNDYNLQTSNYYAGKGRYAYYDAPYAEWKGAWG